MYTLDPQGLEAPALNLGGHLEDQTPQNRRLADVKNVEAQDFLRTVPSNTQGWPSSTPTSLQDAVTTIMTDNGDYYVLGYSPSPYAADDKFHAIDVRVVTRPGLHVRARQGYVASKPAPMSDARSRLMGAVGDPELHSELGLHAFAAPVAVAPNGATTIITLGVSYPALTADQGRRDDDLLVTYVAADPDGHVMKAEPRAFHVVLSGATRDAIDLSLDDVMALPKGRWTLIVGASSQLLGTVGTVHLPVEVRALSGIGLGVESADSRSGCWRAGARSPAGIDRQARAVQPTTARTFTSTQQVRVFARDLRSQDRRPEGRLRVTRGGKALRRRPFASRRHHPSRAPRTARPTWILKGLRPATIPLNSPRTCRASRPCGRSRSGPVRRPRDEAAGVSTSCLCADPVVSIEGFTP